MVMDTVALTARRTTAKLHVRQLFGELVLDPRTPDSYSDLSPKNLAGWERDVRDATVIPYCWFIGEQLGGAFWMHDYGADYAWLGGYVMQAFRGPAYTEARTLGWQACERALRADGIEHLFSVVLAHNKAAQVWTAQCCGLTPLGVYKDWTLNRGQWTDGVVFCKYYPQDQSMAWTLAESRVEVVRRAARASRQHRDARGAREWIGCKAINAA